MHISDPSLDDTGQVGNCRARRAGLLESSRAKNFQLFPQCLVPHPTFCFLTKWLSGSGKKAVMCWVSVKSKRGPQRNKQVEGY